MPKLKLSTVTLISVAGSKHGETIVSLNKSMSKVDFASVKLITNVDLKIEGIECINVGGLKSWSEYNRFIVKELYKYFDTTHCLVVQHDSWILDTSVWRDEFLQFDYIGARGLSDGRPNYNGGFTLRSHKFQESIAKDEFINITAPEDEILTRLYRSYIEKTYGFKYCTDEISDKFAFELHYPIEPTFGFHSFHHEPYRETIVVIRDGALGDTIMVEPVLHYFHKKGYRVALDTQDQFYGVYSQHYFPVIPKKNLPKDFTYKEVNLNMCYESFPKRPVLESYYEMAGIKDGLLVNSRLNLYSGNNEKLFKKYALIHIDSTGMPYRDQHGINWKSVVSFLEDKGYLVFHIGKRIEVPIATYLNTMSLEFMMFIVKGADLFIGLDSGCAQVAVGFNVPSIIMFGSVNPRLRYNIFDKIRVVQSECPKEETKNCYHNKIDVVGTDCIYDKEMPPCTTYTSTQVINAIKSII